MTNVAVAPTTATAKAVRPALLKGAPSAARLVIATPAA
jgi:hypothetical protein